MAKQLGGYELVGKISDSPTGPVYKARQLSMDRVVALKLLPRDAASDAGYVRKFVEEARAAGKVSHPNLVQVYEVAREKNTYFFSMELVEGRTLGELIKERGRLEPAEAARLIQQVASAMEEAHRSGITHRDIRPECIIINADGVAKLSELGLAKRPVGEEETIGTAEYMPPEQSKGEEIDERADVYALGATFYHALTGTVPFEGRNATATMVKHATEPLVPPSRANSTVPASLDGIVSKMMAKKPDERFQRASDVVRAIEAAISRKRRVATAPRRPVRRRTTLSTAAVEKKPFLAGKGPFVIAGALIFLALVVSAGILFSQPKPEAVRAEAALEQARSLRDSGELDEARRLLNAFLAERLFSRNPYTVAFFKQAEGLLKAVSAARAEEAMAAIRSKVEGLRGTGAECRGLKKELTELELSFHPGETDERTRRSIADFCGEMRQVVDARREVYVAQKKREEFARRREKARESLNGALRGAKSLAAGGELTAAAEYLGLFIEDCASADERAPLELLETELVSRARQEMVSRLSETRTLAEAGKYRKAIRMAERLAASAEMPELAEMAAAEARKLAREKAENEAKRFREDRETFRNALASAKQSCKAYRFAEAIGALKSAAKAVKAGALKEELRIETEFAGALKRGFDRLLERINEGQPKLKVSVATKRTEGSFLSADEEKCVIRFQGMDYPKPWSKFSPVEVARLVTHCSKDSLRGMLDAGFFCAMLGLTEQAQGAFGIANMRNLKETEAALRRYAAQLAPVVEAKDLARFEAELAQVSTFIRGKKFDEALSLISKLRNEFADKRFMAAKAGRLDELEKIASAGSAAEAAKPLPSAPIGPMGPAAAPGGRLRPETPEGLKKLGWEVLSGNWQLLPDGTLVGEATMGPAIIEHTIKSIEDFALQFKARIVSGEGCRVRFRWSSSGLYGGRGYAFHFMRTRGRLLTKLRYYYYWGSRSSDPEGFRIMKEAPLPGHKLLTYLVSMRGKRMEAFVNGQAFLSLLDHRVAVGRLGLAVKSGKVEFKDITFREYR